MRCVSVGLPVYNGEPYVGDAITSVLSQTYGNFELIISDNASTDATRDICMKYALMDKRIQYYRNERNMGASYNFNRVYSLSTGRYFKWIAADEGIEPEFLSRCVLVLDRCPDVVVALSKFIGHDEFRKVVQKRDYDYDIIYNCSHKRLKKLLLHTPNPVLPIWGLIRSSVLRQTQLIRPFVLSDHCLVVELVLKGKFAQVPDYLLHIRTHPAAYHTMYLKHGDVQGWRELKWFDAGARSVLVLPHWRALWEYLCLVFSAEEGIPEKLRMASLLILRVGPKWCRPLISEILSTLGLRRYYIRLKKILNPSSEG